MIPRHFLKLRGISSKFCEKPRWISTSDNSGITVSDTTPCTNNSKNTIMGRTMPTSTGSNGPSTDTKPKVRCVNTWTTVGSRGPTANWQGQFNVESLSSFVCYGKEFSTNSSSGSSQLHCWKCKRQLPADGGEFICSECNSIQPPVTSRTYFDILGVDQSFDLDPSELTQKFRNLQRKLHPDKFSQKSTMEQHYSEEHSSLVNKSYQTLLKPLARGLYLLELNGATIEGQSDMEPIFLMEIMETNEELETTDINVIKKVESRNSENLKRHMAALSNAFKNNDIEKAMKEMKRLNYYANIEDKVKELKFSIQGHA